MPDADGLRIIQRLWHKAHLQCLLEHKYDVNLDEVRTILHQLLLAVDELMDSLINSAGT